MAKQAERGFPTEIIDLPSKGLFYPEGHPLASGQIELFYMCAAHEDILTSRNLIQKGTVIDKLLEALIADEKINYEDIFNGDKAAIMVASRILGYGSKYDVKIRCSQCSTESEHEYDLQQVKMKEIDVENVTKGVNEFKFVLPNSKQVITFKLLTIKDEKQISAEIDGMQKVMRSQTSALVTTRMKHSITSVDGNRDKADIQKFVKTMLAQDARAFREYARTVSPDIEMKFDFLCPKCGFQESGVEVPIDSNFFWPDSRI